jgi:predicted dehydrogenase
MALRVGFIGAGGIAQAHLAGVSEHADTRISAVCDVNESRRQEAEKKWGAKPYASSKEMLKAEELDAVYVCLPPGTHGNIELDLAKRGMPFCIEKPVHLNLRTAVRVAESVREKALVTSVGYQVRYAPQVAQAAEFLSGRHVSLVEGWFVVGMPLVPWWRQKALSGGQAVEQTTHIFDLARRVVGEVAEVCAFASTGAMTDIENYDIEDASVALLRFERGAVGHITSGCVLTKGGAGRIGLKADGRDYTLELTYESLKIHSAEGKQEYDHKGALGPAMKKLDNAFLMAVETGDRSGILSDYEDGLKTLALTLAVNESIAKGRPVSPAKLLKTAGH